MPDNVAITAGTGTTVAADEVVDGTLGTVKVQFVKIMDGTLDGTSKAAVGAAGVKVDASGAAVPITDNAGSLTVDNAGTFAVQAAALTDGSQRIEAGGATGAAVPARAIQLGGTDGTLLRAILLDTSGRPIVNINGTVAVSGPLTDAQLRASVVPVSLAAETTKVVGVVRASDTLGNSVSSSGPGFLRVTDEPTQVFYDPFDGAVVDVTTKWTAAFGLGAATTPSQVSGTLTIAAGATSTGWSRLVSQPSFTPPIPAWLGGSVALALPDGAALPASGTRFWGFGSVAATPTTSVPVTDGVGFEMVSGVLHAVVYAAGVRTSVANLSASQPTDAANHRYIVQVRTDRTYWYIDSLATPVATSSFQSPSVQTLPYTMVAVSGGAATTITSAGIAVWDTGKNASQIADATSPWRKATVSAAGALKTDGSAVTQPVSAAALTDGTQVVQLRSSTLVVTGTAAAGTGVTVTLPAVASQFHYITSINIVKYASVATVGAAAATVVTSTNIPGSLAWTLPTALAVGTQYETDVEPAGPIKSSVAGTATTIVAVGLASIIYRITVYYYTAP